MILNITRFVKKVRDECLILDVFSGSIHPPAACMVTTVLIKLKYKYHILPMKNRMSRFKSQKVGVLDGWNIAFTRKEMVAK